LVVKRGHTLTGLQVVFVFNGDTHFVNEIRCRVEIRSLPQIRCREDWYK